MRADKHCRLAEVTTCWAERWSLTLTLTLPLTLPLTLTLALTLALALVLTLALTLAPTLTLTPNQVTKTFGLPLDCARLSGYYSKLTAPRLNGAALAP